HMRSNYQTFMERTRYLRRGDYVWSDLVIAPVAFSDQPGEDLLPVRMVTSLIRHHTVMSHPSVVAIRDGVPPDLDQAFQRLQSAIWTAERLTAGRLAAATVNHLRYNPVGYVLSAHPSLEEEHHEQRQRLVQERKAWLHQEAACRLASSPADTTDSTS
ncbi:MAG: hypothetical protein HQL55_17205, partial [Magnetococcales bacterium]|nr:hypothetical protein [Magnetococcales bacterium]